MKNKYLLLSSVVLFALAFLITPKEAPVTAEHSTPVFKNLFQTHRRDSKKMEGPEYFQRYHQQIRTREGKKLPDYSPGYWVDAWQKARANSVSYRAPLDWIERGPGNVGGSTRGLIVDPEDTTHKTWYVGSVGGGVWRTRDAGEHWELLTKDIPNLATSTLAMSPHNPQVIYAGTGEGFDGLMINGSGIWKSEDKGENWSALAATTSNEDFRNILRLIVNPKDEKELIACTVSYFKDDDEDQLVSKIMRSTDGGKNWQQTHQERGTTIQQIVYAPDDFRVQYASVKGKGILKSNDSGQSWTEVMSVSPSNIQRMEIAISPIRTDYIYISAEATDGSRLYVSRDGMQTIQQVHFEGGVTPDWLGGQGYYDNAIAAHPFDANQVWVGGTSALLSLHIGDKEDSIKFIEQYDLNLYFLEEYPEDYQDIPSLGQANEIVGQLGYTTETGEEDFVNVEVRFGPQYHQNAHILDFDFNSTSLQYTGYEEVPFEIWDVDNNRQLMASIIDFNGDGRWTLYRDINDIDIFPDLVVINTLDYSITPNRIIATTNPAYKSQYYFYFQIAADYMGSLDSFPEGQLNIRVGLSKGLTSNFNAIADG